MKDKVVLTIPEVAKLLGFSRNFGYELARRGELPGKGRAGVAGDRITEAAGGEAKGSEGHI